MPNTWPTNTKPLAWSTSLVTEGPTFPPTGERSAWPFDPAWPPAGREVRETYTFQTEILVSRSGREYRLAHRSAPRRQVEQAVFLAHDGLRRYKDFLWAWQHRDVVLADIFLSLELPAAMPAGTDTLVLADPPGWMLPGAAVVIGLGAHREALTVGGVAGDATYFTTGTERDWPAGTPVFPGLIGNLAMEMDADRETNEVARGNLTFAVRPLSEVPRTPDAPDRSFDGREVFTGRPNWADRVSSSLAHDVDVLDYGTGPVSRYAAVDFGREITGATYLGRNRDEVAAMLDLFWRMRGRQGEFWAPTWEPDFVLRSGATQGSDTLRVRGDTLVNEYNGRATHKAIFVKLVDGTLALAKVSTLALIDDATGRDTLVTLTASWAQPFSTDDVVMAGWLLLRRFASDSLVVEWLTDGVANVRLNLMTLEALPEETGTP